MYLFRVKPPKRIQHGQELCVLPCSCGKVFKGETCRPQKIRLVRSEFEKSGMEDHIWKENGNHLKNSKFMSSKNSL